MSFVYEVEKKSMEINLYGEKHKMRFATWEELEKWDDELLRKLTIAEIVAHQKQLLIMLGLPEAVVNKIDSIDIKPLVKFVKDPEGTGAKKS